MTEEKNKTQEKETIDITTPTSLILIRKLARGFSSFLGDDIYHLNTFTHYLFNLIGKEKVINLLKKDESDNYIKFNDLGNNFDKFYRKWKEFDNIIIRCKGYWDKIENKDFKKITDKDLKNYFRYARYVPNILDDLMTLTIFMISNSSIKRMSVPSDAWIVPSSTFGRQFKIEKQKVGEPVIHHE